MIHFVKIGRVAIEGFSKEICSLIASEGRLKRISFKYGYSFIFNVICKYAEFFGKMQRPRYIVLHHYNK
jgi:hypothetical protein